MVYHLQRTQLLAQRTLIRLKRAYTLPVGATFDRRDLEDGRFVLLARWPHLDSPTFDMVASTWVDFHVIPVIACEIFDHRLRQHVRIPLAFKVVSPHARWNSINLFTL